MNTTQATTGRARSQEPRSWFEHLIEVIASTRVLSQLMAAVAVLAVLIYGTATFPLKAHVILSLVAIAVAMIVTRLFPEYRLVSVMLSLALSLRYIIWRGLETLNFDHGLASAIVSLLLYGAELYTVFVLVGGYFQTTVFYDRRPQLLPKDPERLPTIDVFIPTYNEGVDIVRRTVVAALAMDYPKKKVWILDDGRRPAMKGLADEVGAGYITRSDNKHAKSGNVNNALKQTNGELIAFFDADHAPVRTFLQLTIGFFLNNGNLALVQTPHHFYNPDPFERNLYTAGRIPPEQNLFYHLVQVSNDFWNSAFFCGSCAVIRRTALEDIGGMAVETVTEDAHTAMKMQAKGWDTAYLNIPQAAGLATERFADYVGQRIRWARGMGQILRMDPPFLKRGLTWYQRVNYTFAASHFFFGLPRLIFLLAPVTYLVFGLNPLDEDVRVVMLYAAPHLILAYINASAAHGNQRHTFWPEVYETAIAPYTALVTTIALIAPKKGRFNVTPKGALVNSIIFDWRVVWMLIVIFAFCLTGLPAFVMRYSEYPMERATLWVALGWNVYNLMLLLAAMATAIERPQRRTSYRIPSSVPVVVFEQAEVLPSDDPLDEAEELDERSYTSVDGVDPVEVYEDMREDALRMETSEASFASRLQATPSARISDHELPPDAWRAAGRTIDLSEDGVRFVLNYEGEIPRHMLVTLLSHDNTRLSLQAEALDAWRSSQGTVVRARFRHTTDAQVHQLIRIMFSDPNAWARDKFIKDRPLDALVDVLTSPLRAIAYARAWLPAPAEHLPPPVKARSVHRPVLLCFHCQGVLIRPEGSCPHCDKPLMTADPATSEPWTGTFDRVGHQSEDDRPSWVTYLVPGMLLLVALLLALGWQGMFQTPDASLSASEELTLSYRYSATDGVRLSDELLAAISSGGVVKGTWGAKIASLRFEFPRAEDPRERVHEGRVPDTLAELFYRLHHLESRYRRNDASDKIMLEVRQVREGFDNLF
jgi:cellulose synthase catalytic subunit (UDP-forming)